MKLLTLLPPALLCTLTTATSENTSSSQPPSSPPPAPEAEPTPAGALWTATWTTSTLAPYTQHCRARSTYTARIYALHELYPDLEAQAPQLKVFYNKQHYAGSWGGIDVHGTGRELVRMDMSALPYKVREWLKQNGKQRHYSVQDSEVFFAPGAIYPILPLWVDEGDDVQPECEGVLEDLERYSNEVKDGAVVGKVQHTKTGDKEVRFSIEALLVKAREGGKDEL
ncbi:hypothetical protein ACN47E_006715 [Coniothyrium glycines]